MDNERDSASTEWTVLHGPPHIPWDESRLLGSEPSGARPPVFPRILLVGLSHDLELAHLARRLSHTSATLRIVLLDLITDLPTWHSSIDTSEEFDVGYCRAYRSDRPVHYHHDRSLRKSEAWGRVEADLGRYAAEQVDTVFWALMTRLRVARWVNSPWEVRAAENKLVQLDAALTCDFDVPRTLVTSDRDEISSFVKQFPDGAVSKSLDSPLTAPGEEVTAFRYTSLIDTDSIEGTTFPQLFQERIRPRMEFRVTAVGRQIFAAKVDTSTAGATSDWRSDTDNHTSFEATLLPDDLRSKVAEVMNRLCIQVGAVDLLYARGRYYFLEVNPSCAYLWLERSLEVGISSAVMRLLLTP